MSRESSLISYSLYSKRLTYARALSVGWEEAPSLSILRHTLQAGLINAFTTEQVMVDLKDQGVVLGKRKKNDVAEECRFAYKDIDEVMAQQTDIVTPVRKLRTVGVVKG